MSEFLTCVLCPLGCELEIDRAADGLRVRGGQCDKGEAFAAEELLRPLRNLATSVPLRGTAARMVSVRLTGPIPRDMIFPVLAAIGGLRPEPPVNRGDILIRDVLGTGVDVIATRTVLESPGDSLYNSMKHQGNSSGKDL
jgi:CxxC motif-containing protein